MFLILISKSNINYLGTVIMQTASTHSKIMSAALIFICAVFPFANAAIGGAVSDDFSSGVLNEGVWRFVNPLDDSSYSMTGNALLINVPGAVSHNIDVTNKAPRMMQDIENVDFEIEAKFDSELSVQPPLQYQVQGLIVEEDSDSYIRLDLVSDSSGVLIYCSLCSDGYILQQLRRRIPMGAPYYLSIERSGTRWTVYYSYDGVDWIYGTRFWHSIGVNSVGITAANHAKPQLASPPFICLADYFFEASNVIYPEDGDPNANTVTAVIDGGGSVVKSPDQNFYSTGTDIELTAVADTGWLFNYWDGSFTGIDNPIDLTINGNIATKAVFVFDPVVPQWLNLSNATGDLPVPAESRGQIDVRMLDIDKNGENDLIMTAWESTESIAWYRQQNGSFSKYIIASTSPTNLTHCHNFVDIDNDGDTDLIFGEAGEGNSIYWWENPYPDFDASTTWTQRLVRSEGGNMYHDSIWGDFDGDGKQEYVSWNQYGNQLLLFEIPADPRTSGTWPATPIFTWSGTQPIDKYSGIDAVDINGDGKVDIVGGGGWFEHTGGTNFTYHLIDDAKRFDRCVAGQIIPGGWAEVVYADERKEAPLSWYKWNGTSWIANPIEILIPRTHTLQLGDINGDGHMDIMTAEMGEWEPLDNIPGNPDARIRVFYGSGTGHFAEQLIADRQGSLEGQLGDIDKDGDLDIISKPFGYNIPRLDIWLNTGLDPNVRSLTVNVIGGGGVIKNPDQVTYNLGDTVELTAAADSGWFFDSWSGDIASSDNPVFLTITDNHNITATFTPVPDINEPTISNINIITTANSATVSWDTDEPSTSDVDYGKTVSYELGQVYDSALVTQHSVILPYLAAETLYHCQIISEDPSGNQAVSADQDFITGVASAAIVSDDFSGGTIDSNLWTFINPLNDANVEVAANALLISVPEGTSHDIWKSGNNAPRLMQPAPDIDFEIEAKFDSEIYLRYQFQGLLIEQDDGNFLRFEVQQDGSNILILAVIFNDGVPTIKVYDPIQASSPYYLRLRREGDNWRFFYSSDNIEWTQAVSFNHSMVVSNVGVYAANHGTGGVIPAFTGIVDYFFNTALPIIPEDGDPNQCSIIVNVSGNGTVQVDPQKEIYSVGEVVELTAVADPNWAFWGWTGIADTTANPVLLTVTGNHIITATFTSDVPFYEEFDGNDLDANNWEFINPLGDANFTLESSRLSIYVPNDVSHDIWSSGNKAPCIMHAVENSDLEVEVKFDSEIDLRYQMQGLLIEQDSGNFLRFEVHHNGSARNIFAAEFVDGVPKIKVYEVITAQAPYYLAVTREGNTWTLYYSLDDVDWKIAKTFQRAMTVNKVGVFAANHGETGNIPEFTGIADYFFCVGKVVEPGNGGSDEYILDVNVTGGGSVEKTPDANSYASGQSVELLAIPDSGWSFTSWAGDAVSTQNPLNVVMTSDMDIEAIFAYQDPNKVALNINILGNGLVTKDPNHSSYTAGDIVTLTANPDTQWEFDGWSGDISSTTNPFNLTMDSDCNITATFVETQDTTAPVISNITATPSADSAQISWFTDEPATGSVLWGLSDNYESGSVENPSLLTNHQFSISGLTPATQYHYKVASADEMLNEANSTDLTFTTSANPGASGILSDDFSSSEFNYNLWEFIDPLNDADLEMTGNALLIHVPAGMSHNIWESGNFAPRVMQSVQDADFEIEVKFDSDVYFKYQLQGFIVEESEGNFLRFEVQSDGSSVLVFAASFKDNLPTVKIYAPIQLSSPYYLRLRREGDNWTFLYSGDQTQWTQAVSFYYPIIVNKVGVFAGNHGSDGFFPAFTAIVDYFFNTAAPIVPEDGDPNQNSVYVNVSGNGSVQMNSEKDSYALGETVELTAVADEGYSFVGWSGAIDGNSNPAILTVNGNMIVTASFVSSEAFYDEFDSNTIDERIWTYYDPLGDCNVSLTNGKLRFDVAAGVSHDVWGSGNKAPRLMQDVGDTDFEIRAKFDSPVELKYQLQGLIVEQGIGNFLRFNVQSEGADTKIYVGSFVDGTPETKMYSTIVSGEAYYLSVTRQQNVWKLYYSYDGQQWYEAVTFYRDIIPGKVGIFAANHGTSGDAPQFTCYVDHFYNSAPGIIANSDPNRAMLTINTEGNGTVLKTPEKQFYDLGETVELSAVADDGHKFIGWQGDLQTTQNPITITVDSDYKIDALFDIIDANSPIDIWYGDRQSFGHIGNPQRWINILGNLPMPQDTTFLAYYLNGEPQLPLSFSTQNSIRLAREGNFNVEIAADRLRDGLNYVRILAFDGTDNPVSRTVMVDYESGNVWPQNYSIQWDQVDNISDVAQIVDGDWVIEPNGIRPTVAHYDRLISIGDVQWKDYEVTVDVTLHQSHHNANPPNPPGLGILIGWTGHYDWYGQQPRIGWWPLGAIGWYRWGTTADSGSFQIMGNYGVVVAADRSGEIIQPGIKYTLKFKVQTSPDQGAIYSFKAWPASLIEPDGWRLTTQQLPTDPQNGSILLIAHYVDATFGDVTIVPIN